MPRLPSLILALAFAAITSGPASAHRPYFTSAKSILLPDGRPGELRILRGDGILFADPARLLLLDETGRLLARSHRSTAITFVCDRDRRACRGYDGGTVLTPDPAAFRPGETVPGIGDADRGRLWTIESGEESWGFTARPATFLERVRGELALALGMPRALAITTLFGAVGAMLLTAGPPPANGNTVVPALRRWFGILLRLAGTAITVLAAVYVALLIGITTVMWLVSAGSGAGIVLLWRHAKPSPVA